MINFSDFEKPQKKFVGLFLDDESQARMEMYCLENKFDLSVDYDKKPTDKFKFHTTIFFTNNEVNFPNGEEEIEPVILKFDGIDLFGPAKNIPVLKIRPTNELIMIRKFFEKQGFEDPWPSWKPHMSISYNYENQDLRKIKMPYFNVYATLLKIEDQK